MIYETDLFSFSFVPNWYLQLDALAELALSEPWRFRSGGYSEKNYDRLGLDGARLPAVLL